MKHFPGVVPLSWLRVSLPIIVRLGYLNLPVPSRIVRTPRHRTNPLINYEKTLPLPPLLPSTVTKPITSREISNVLTLATQNTSFMRVQIWKIAQNKLRSAIREGGPRRLVSHAWRAATRQLLKTADQPILREKSDISPRNVPDNETTPPGF